MGGPTSSAGALAATGSEGAFASSGGVSAASCFSALAPISASVSGCGTFASSLSGAAASGLSAVSAFSPAAGGRRAASLPAVGSDLPATSVGSSFSSPSCRVASPVGSSGWLISAVSGASDLAGDEPTSFQMTTVPATATRSTSATTAGSHRPRPGTSPIGISSAASAARGERMTRVIGCASSCVACADAWGATLGLLTGRSPAPPWGRRRVGGMVGRRRMRGLSDFGSVRRNPGADALGVDRS